MMLVVAYAIPILLAVGLGLGVSVFGFLQYRATARIAPELRLVVLLLVVGIGAMLSVALTTRELDDTRITGLMTYGDVADGFTASRWLSLFLVVASFLEVARGWVEDQRRPAPDPARPLLLTMLAYYVGTILVQAVASDETGFSPRDFYVPVVLAAVYYQRTSNLSLVFGAARGVILALMLSSLAGHLAEAGLRHPSSGLRRHPRHRLAALRADAARERAWVRSRCWASSLETALAGALAGHCAG